MNEKFFNQIKKEYERKNLEAKAKGQPMPGVPILTQGSFRSEQYINATTTQYNFGVLQSDIVGTTGTVLPTEVRLQQNDNFHISRIGLYVALTSASTDTNFILQTYPDEVEFTANTRLGMLNIYNGYMKINVNQVDVLTNWRLSQHYFVPQTQRISASASTNRDQVDLSTNSMIPCTPSLMLSGAYTNLITINLPGTITNATAANNSRLILIFDGLRAQNAAIRK